MIGKIKFHFGEPKRVLQTSLFIFLATTFALSTSPSRSEQQTPAAAPSNDIQKPVDTETQPSPAPAEQPNMDEVIQYLWNVYRRSTTKLDSHGDFTWKDVAAATRLGLSLPEYVIGGMDGDFREQLFHLGKALDSAGIDWTISSAFRDDYRQSLAVGLRARAGNSFHGGSAATGGYGHGCAVDIASTDGQTNDIVWDWLGHHSEEFGLFRPLPRIDPAHVQAHGPWHALAAALRNKRIEDHPEDRPGDTAASDVVKPVVLASEEQPSESGLTYEQFTCTRPAVASLPAHIETLHFAPLRTAPARKIGAEVKWKGTDRFAIRRPMLHHAARTS